MTAMREIEQIRADLLAITGALAGVGTVCTEEQALRSINALASVQAAWRVALSGATWEETWAEMEN